jgi:HAD superfamily hydrolase (TIGR01549 family)
LLKGVILDIDGTLVDSNDAHAHSWVETLREAGYDVPFGVIRPMIGMGGDKLLPAAVGIESDSDAGKRLGERRWEIFSTKYLPNLRAFPGSRALAKRMKQDGLQLVVASSAGSEELDSLLDAAEVADIVDRKTSSSDVEESKPDPEIVQTAVRKSGFDAEELVMLGDTPYDVAAATGAHVPIIGFLCGGWKAEELTGAVAVYAGPGELLEWYDESLLGQRKSKP